MIAQIEALLKALIPALAILGAGYFVLLWRRINEQKKQNQIDAYNNQKEKINLDVGSTPLDELIANSNSSHSAMVKDPREGDKK